MTAAYRFIFVMIGAVVCSGASPVAAADSPAAPIVAIYKATYPVAHQDTTQTPFQDKALRRRYFTASFRAVAESIKQREIASNGIILDADPILASNGPVDGDNPVVTIDQQQGDHARVKATFGSPKFRRSVIYSLVKEGGSWRIDDIKQLLTGKSGDVWSVRKISDEDLAADKK
jgi:hypothetical protein